MLTTIFAKKAGMTGKYTPEKERAGVTILTIPQQKVRDLRTKEKNGYGAVRVEINPAKGKPMIREIRTEEKPEPGSEIRAEEIFQTDDRVNISGISKGKGFAGVVKRHHFKGGPRTHGQSDRERAPGSSGSTTTPGRVFRGTRRAGHMGSQRVMMKKLRILEIDPEHRTMTVQGAVPGFARRGQLLTVSKAR